MWFAFWVFSGLFELKGALWLYEFDGNMKQRRRRVSEAKKKKGFRSKEEERFRGFGSKEAEGVSLRFLALFMELCF